MVKPTPKGQGEPVKEDEFYVDKLLDHKITSRGYEFKVRWYGYDSDEDTWEPAENIPMAIRNEYINNRLKASKKASVIVVDDEEEEYKTDLSIPHLDKPANKATSSITHDSAKRNGRRPKQPISTVKFKARNDLIIRNYEASDDDGKYNFYKIFEPCVFGIRQSNSSKKSYRFLLKKRTSSQTLWVSECYVPDHFKQTFFQELVQKFNLVPPKVRGKMNDDDPLDGIRANTDTLDDYLISPNSPDLVEEEDDQQTKRHKGEEDYMKYIQEDFLSNEKTVDNQTVNSLEIVDL